MTIADKLRKVLNTKNALKQALIDKGVEISDTDSFDSYVGKIQNIASSELGVVYNGLVGYADAISNYIGGTHSNTTKIWYGVSGVPIINSGSGTYFTADAFQPSKNLLQAFNTSPKDCRMNETKEFTLESVFTINSTGSAGVMIGAVENGGCAIRISGSGGVYTQLTSSQNVEDWEYCTGIYSKDSPSTAYTTPLSKKIYVCLRYKNGITTNFCSTNEKFTSYTNAITPNFSTTGLFSIGFNGSTTLSSDGSILTGGTISMCRVYNRCLTDEEVLQNYKHEKERFDITPFTLTINPTPSDATVNFSLNNNDNLVVDGNTAKISGCTSVTYTVSASGYKPKSGTINMASNTTLDVRLDAE